MTRRNGATTRRAPNPERPGYLSSFAHHFEIQLNQNTFAKFALSHAAYEFVKL
jgi:hypothetical protein